MVPFAKSDYSAAPPESAAVQPAHDAGGAASYFGCGRGCILGTSPDGKHHVVIPVRCQSWTCPDCAPTKLLAWRRKILAGKPERLITLTIRREDGLTPKQATDKAKTAWPMLVRYLRKEFKTFEYAAAWQLTAAGFPHIHIAQRGTYIPKRMIREFWHKHTGSFIVDIRPIHNPAIAANYVSRYMLRDASSTQAVLQDRRIITRSKHWDLTSHDELHNPAWDGWHWSYTLNDPEDEIAWYVQNGYTPTTNETTAGLWLFLSPDWSTPPDAPPPPLRTALKADIEPF